MLLQGEVYAECFLLSAGWQLGPRRPGRSILLIEMWERTRVIYLATRQSLTTALASAGILADGPSDQPLKAARSRASAKLGQEAEDAWDGGFMATLITS